MAKQPLGVPVSLILLIGGALVIYYILHSNGWTWGGSVPVDLMWKHLSLTYRALTVGALIMTTVGLGGLVNGIGAKKS